MTYTIDQLAAETGFPSRRIRFYQTKGLLPAPAREGRTAIYDESHVERLRVIGELQDRGLRLSAIAEMLAEGGPQDPGVRQWLGISAGFEQAWASDEPIVVTEAELMELLGGGPPGTVAELLRLGMIERQGERLPRRYVVPSPGLLEVGRRLGSAGIPMTLQLMARDIITKRMRQAAGELVDHFLAHAEANEQSTEEVEQVVDVLRPAAAEAVQLIFLQEVEAALVREIERPRRRNRRT